MRINFKKSIKYYENMLESERYSFSSIKKYINLVIAFIKKKARENPELSCDDINNKLYESMNLMVFNYV